MRADYSNSLTHVPDSGFCPVLAQNWVHNFLMKNASTHKPLYYDMSLDITAFKDRSQKWIDYIEKNDYKW